MAELPIITRSAQGQYVDNAPEMRLTVFNEDGEVIARLTTDTMDTAINNNVFDSYVVKVELPSDPETKDPQVIIEVGNAYNNGELLGMVNGFTSIGSAKIRIELYPREEPEEVELDMTMDILSANIGKKSISFTVGFTRILSLPFMRFLFTPNTSPGLF